MPRPNPGEKKSEFISRAIKYLMEKEGLSQKQAIGKAYGLWETYHVSKVLRK